MRDKAMVQEVLLAAQNTKLAQQLADAQKHAGTNLGSLPEYCFKFSSDITSEYQQFRRRFLNSAHENVRFCRQRIEGLDKEALALLVQIFQTLESHLDKKLPNV